MNEVTKLKTALKGILNYTETKKPKTLPEADVLALIGVIAAETLF